MLKMRAVQVASPNGPLELVERDLPEPGRGEVRVKVQACGAPATLKFATFADIRERTSALR